MTPSDIRRESYTYPAVVHFCNNGGILLHNFAYLLHSSIYRVMSPGIKFYTFFYTKRDFVMDLISESEDTLRRDGANTPISLSAALF